MLKHTRIFSEPTGRSTLRGSAKFHCCRPMSSLCVVIRSLLFLRRLCTRGTGNWGCEGVGPNVRVAGRLIGRTLLLGREGVMPQCCGGFVILQPSAIIHGDGKRLVWNALRPQPGTHEFLGVFCVTKRNQRFHARHAQPVRARASGTPRLASHRARAAAAPRWCHPSRLNQPKLDTAQGISQLPSS
jgi:hypothetical protein